MATTETKPESKIVKRRKGFALYANGELWTTGRHAYRCGYVADPENIDTAIDTHREELAALMAEAHAEFGS